MKLASLKSGGRDGALIVVSRDLSRALEVGGIAPNLQYALENWDSVSHHLALIYQDLNMIEEIGNYIRFDPKACAAPLPRAYQWLDGSAYVNHVELVRKSRGATLPESFWTDPLMYQGGSDDFLGPTADIALADDMTWGIDLEAELAVITGDVPMGIAAAAAGAHIRLLMLVNDVSLRGLIPPELAKGFGFVHGKPATAFSPVAVTPDELGAAWDGAKVNLPLVSHINGREFGRPHAGTDMVFGFPALIAHAAKTRNLRAGAIVGSGTVSNKSGDVGYACIAEIRAVETIRDGKPSTPFLKFGDRVRIEMLDGGGHSIFGAIDQLVTRYTPPE